MYMEFHTLAIVVATHVHVHVAIAKTIRGRTTCMYMYNVYICKRNRARQSKNPKQNSEL